MKPPSLPIDSIVPDVVRSLRKCPNLVLVASAGAGKTTRIAPALLAASVPAGGRVLVVEPRRIAARSAARRVAAERGWQVGGEVGYRVRFDSRVGPVTRLEFVTEGILLHRLLTDPFLEDTSLVVFDEFHERRLLSDLALALVRSVQREVRPELGIVVMSATLEPAPVAGFLGDAPILECPGRVFPVEVSYLETRPERPLAETVAIGVRQALAKGQADVLAFLPGVAEILRTAELLAPEVASQGLLVLPLYGDLPAADQDRALSPAGRRRVVLATNVAESSVTVEGIETVVDSGFARQLRFDPGCGLDRLELVRISRASADQRAGRAGRQRPGLVLRLWTEHEHRGLPERDVAEVKRLDLAAPLLQLAAWGEPDPAAFAWFEQPPEQALAQAKDLLADLGLLGPGGLTSLGRRVANLPVHPRLACLLAEAYSGGCLVYGARVAALLSERPAWRTRARESKTEELAEQLASLDDQRLAHGSQVLRLSAHLEHIARQGLGPGGDEAKDPEAALGRALITAFPDRLARRRGPAVERSVLAGGRGVRIGGNRVLRDSELVICLDLDAGVRGERAEGRVYLAAPIQRAWFPEDKVVRELEVAFDQSAERVVAWRRTRFNGLVIDEWEQTPPAAEASAELARAAALDLDQALPLGDAEVASFLDRLRWLAGEMPELGLPVFTDEDLLKLLPTVCAGRRSFAELRKLPLVDLLEGLLSHQQLQTLDREAPERLTVPSGSQIRLRYEPGRPPVLAARIQELFGLAATPRLAGGRAPVLVHLLAPSYRPQQVTSDLASFWRTTYLEVRKELAGRYPKHAWPDDPLHAAAVKGPRRPTKHS